MPDDTAQKTRERDRIDVHEAYKLGYSSRRFGVTREELSEAIQKVGTIQKI